MSDIEYSVIKSDVIKSFDCICIAQFLNIEFENYKLTSSNFHYNEKRYKRAALYKYAYMSEVMNLCELYKSYTSIHVYS